MTSRQPHASVQTRWPVLLLPIVALLPVLPLILHGPSCGHDFDFHMQSWMDAAEQIRHGHLLPRWAISAAYNAGEPRFTFYPPLSWLLGALFMLALPASAAPAGFTWLALTGAALAMYALARRFTTSSGSVLAAAAYIANPYALFTAFERTAYAELLAAAWMPLLFRAALAEQPSAVAVAIPLALLWLTNAPAAVMGTYALVVIVLCRASLRWWAAGTQAHAARPRSWQRLLEPMPLLTPALGGIILGFSLAGLYLVPAAWERRYVQIAMAIIPNMRVEDNFLFGHTGYGPHDQVLHTASLVAVVLLIVTSGVLATALGQTRSRTTVPSAVSASGTSPRTVAVLAVLTLLIAAMLTPPALPLWHVLPELAFLQFPWRLLAVLGCVLGLGIAMSLGRRRIPLALATALALAAPAISTPLSLHAFRQGCDAQELPSAHLALFKTHHGVGPTDEYTPTAADNDQLRWDDPAWWLASNPNAPGPGTVPNPAATILDYDQPPPLEQTVSGRAPMHLDLHLAAPADLILNLRDYPAWRVILNGTGTPPHLQRDDGLIAIALPAGRSTVDVHWHTLPDVWLGDALSLCALAVVTSLWLRSRRIEP